MDWPEKNDENRRIPCRQCKSTTVYCCKQCKIALHPKCFVDFHKMQFFCQKFRKCSKNVFLLLFIPEIFKILKINTIEIYCDYIISYANLVHVSCWSCVFATFFFSGSMRHFFFKFCTHTYRSIIQQIYENELDTKMSWGVGVKWVKTRLSPLATWWEGMP